MNNAGKLDLSNIPWPASILKFKQAMDDMDAHKNLVVIFKDQYLVENVSLILDSLPEFSFRISRLGTYHHIHVNKL